MVDLGKDQSPHTRNIKDHFFLSEPQRHQMLAARDELIDWLNRRNFANFNFSRGQLSDVKLGLADIQDHFEGGTADVSILDHQSDMVMAEFSGDSHKARLITDVKTKDIRFVLEDRCADFTSQDLLYQAVARAQAQPYYDDGTLMEFWIVDTPDRRQVFQDASFWAKKLIPDLGAKDTAITRAIPGAVRRHLVGDTFQAYWTAPEYTDLVVTINTIDDDTIPYIFRKLTQNNGRTVFVKRGNFDMTNLPQRQEERQTLPQGILQPVPVEANIQ